MKFNSSKLFFLASLIVGIMVCISSNNWIMIWCGLEISLISFIPLMSSKMILTSESSIKYFLIQSISSALLILGLIMMLSGTSVYEMIILTSIMLKMGVAPFHNWVLSIVDGLSFQCTMMLLTIMKAAPLMLMSFFKLNLNLIIIFTMMIGSILGLNQSSTRKIMAYSSIFNMGLILCTINVNMNWVMYYTLYSLVVVSVIMIMAKMNVNYINQMVTNDKSLSMNINLWFMLMSLGGMPPFLGFVMKLIVIEFLIKQSMILMMIILIISSLMVMFFYVRMTYLSVLLFSSQTKMINMNMDLINSEILMLNIMILPVTLYIKALL
nr:NADH dehydrogenase subunit 2 [Michalowskiya breviprocessa]